MYVSNNNVKFLHSDCKKNSLYKYIADHKLCIFLVHRHWLACNFQKDEVSATIIVFISYMFEILIIWDV